MKLMWIKIVTLAILGGSSFGWYTFGGPELTVRVPITPEESLPPATSYTEALLPEPVLEEREVVRRVSGEMGSQLSGEFLERPEGKEEVISSSLPESARLDVPFTSQAPMEVWDAVHEETCEEASLLMVHAFYEGTVRGHIDPNTAEDVLQDMVESERMMFGYFEDTTLDELKRFAQAYYGYDHIERLERPSVEMIKTRVAQGYPVIVPTAGRLLDNPFFSGAGPRYHMVVVKGYTKDGFIVNDPGTRRGADWVYPYDVFMKAIHDWEVPEGIEDRPETIPESARVAMVIYPTYVAR